MDHNSITMKKGLVTCLAVVFSAAVFAQDASDKKVQMGLAYQFGLNFVKPNTKTVSRSGVGSQNSIGLNVNFNFNDNIGFATGLEFDFESFRLNYSDSTYYAYNDTKIYLKEDNAPSDSKVYRLDERKYKSIYVSIPTFLMFRTNPLGDFRYYGKFGVRTSFLAKYQMNDKGDALDVSNMTYTSSENKGMRTPYGNDIVFIRSAVGVGGGAQWNFTGSTVLFAEIMYNYVFTPIQKADSDKEDKMSLYRMQGVNKDYFRFKSNQSLISLKIGILF